MKPKPRLHFNELDGYRGCAALLVVMYHVYTYSSKGRAVYTDTPLHPFFDSLHGAVAWFFVLSGFLIFLPFAQAALNQRAPESTRGFLVRRAIRILPAYVAVILPTAPVLYTHEPSQMIDLLKHLLFIHIFDDRTIFSILSPAWSVGDEVIYYLFLAGLGPLLYQLCRACATRRARTTAMALPIGALIGASILYKVWAYAIAGIPLDVNHGSIYNGPAAKFDTFGIGMLLAVAYATRERPLFGLRQAQLLRIGGGLLLLGLLPWRLSSTPAELSFATLSGVGFALLLGSTILGPRPSRWETLLTAPPLRGLGLVSYSLYLWHEMVILLLIATGVLVRGSALAFPICLLITIACSLVVATASYRFIERPALQLRKRFATDGIWRGLNNRTAVASQPGD
ncbi:MAG: acyltransferase [Thermomicrobiales bacterium]